MNIEEMVRTSMDQLARDLQPPVPNPADVRARVNRSRRIRSIAVVGLAAAAAAGALVVGVAELRDRSSGPGPTHPVEIGVDANAVWMVDGVLHIGDQAYPQDKTIETALVPIESGAVYGAAGGEIVYQPLQGPAQVIATDAKWGPAADPDSDLVAWLQWSKPDGRYDLWLYDTGRGSEISAIPLEAALTGRDNPFGGSPLTPIEWVGANPEEDYTVLFSGADGGPRRVDAKANGAATIRELGTPADDMTLDILAVADQENQIMFTSPAGGDISSADGVRADGGLSHDGAYFAGLSSDPDHSGAIAVVDTQTGDVGFIDPQTGTVPTFLSWSSGHTLMFRATDVATQPSGLVVACDVDTLACVNVAEVDDISTVTLPTL